MRYAILIAAALTLAGCAGVPDDGRPSEFERLSDECRERGGILVSSGQPSTGRPQIDNVCEIRGASSITRR